MDFITLAIKLLKPNAEFVFYNNDYSTIEWLKITGKAPTQAEIDAAIEKIKSDQIAEANDAETKKMAAQAKLTALGLTADDLKALGL